MNGRSGATYTGAGGTWALLLVIVVAVGAFGFWYATEGEEEIFSTATPAAPTATLVPAPTSEVVLPCLQAGERGVIRGWQGGNPETGQVDPCATATPSPTVTPEQPGGRDPER